MPGVRSPERAGLMRGRFQARALKRSNKRMHATADTEGFIFHRSGLAARDARR